jgi:alcohol dehydrogenase, propanol-preferring
MKAFQYERSALGVEMKDVPVPEPAEGQVLVKVEAAGLCHSDCTIMNGKGNWVSKTPITLGHEVAGKIVRLGQGVSNFQIGDEVVIAQISHPLETANWATAVGLGYDGGYAEYAISYMGNLVKIPDGVTFAQAAVATDSISTAYHAVVTEGRVTGSTTVGIVGLGGLGLNGVAIASLQGATVYGFDIATEKFEDAIRSGATKCFFSLNDASDITFDVILDFAGVGTTTAAAIGAVKLGGTVVLVGLGAAEMTISTHVLVTRGVKIRGSIGASLQELQIVLDLIAAGKICPVIQEIPFSEVGEALGRLDRNEVLGRLFTRPGKN